MKHLLVLAAIAFTAVGCQSTGSSCSSCGTGASCPTGKCAPAKCPHGGSADSCPMCKKMKH